MRKSLPMPNLRRRGNKLHELTERSNAEEDAKGFQRHGMRCLLEVVDTLNLSETLSTQARLESKYAFVHITLDVKRPGRSNDVHVLSAWH